MAQDLQQEFNELQRLYEQRQRESVEAQARLKALDEREQELRQEMRQLGIDDPDKLEATIAAEEAAMRQELDALRQLLQPTQIPALATVPREPMQIDDILLAGSS